MSKIDPADFQAALALLLKEVFSEVDGWVLDKNTSLLETLADISALEASIPVGGRCATLAAQVKHVAFYFDFVERSARTPTTPPADWDEVWRTTNSVEEAEWTAIQQELQAAYGRILRLLEDTNNWADQRTLISAMATLAHTAYHLGEIRQALCILRP